MEDDQYDDLLLEDEIENLPYSTLLYLDENYQANPQDAVVPPRQVLEPTRPSLKRNPTSITSNGTAVNRSNLQDPSRHLRPPLSLGDTDIQNLDAGVLDDGVDMDLVGEQNTVFQNQEDSVHDGREPMAQAQQPFHGAPPLTIREYRAGTEDNAAQLSKNDTYNPVNGLSQGFADDAAANADSYALAELEDMKEQIEQVCLLGHRIKGKSI